MGCVTSLEVRQKKQTAGENADNNLPINNVICGKTEEASPTCNMRLRCSCSGVLSLNAGK